MTFRFLKVDLVAHALCIFNLLIALFFVFF